MCHRVWLCPELSVFAILHNSHNTIATTKDCSRQFDDDKECLLLACARRSVKVAIDFCNWDKIAISVLLFGEYTCWPTIREQQRILYAKSIPVICFLHRKGTGTDFSQLVLGSGNFTRHRWYLEPTRTTSLNQPLYYIFDRVLKIGIIPSFIEFVVYLHNSQFFFWL